METIYLDKHWFNKCRIDKRKFIVVFPKNGTVYQHQNPKKIMNINCLIFEVDKMLNNWIKIFSEMTFLVIKIENVNEFS